MGSKPSGATTSTTKTEPWEGQQDYYKDIFSQAQSLYNSGGLAPKAYTGDSIANITPEQQQAQQMIKDKATGGNPVDANAQQLTADTLSGKYLDVSQNPAFSQGLEDIKKAYSTGTAAQTDKAAATSGAFGGSAYNELVGMNERSYADALNKFGGDMYNQERTRQNQALALSPGISAAGYNDANQLYNVGAQGQDQNQAEINSLMEKFNIENQAPISALQYYQGLIGGNMGGTSTQSTPYYQNRATGALGGAASGAMAGSMFGPWGTAIGGGVGLLGGLFG